MNDWASAAPNVPTHELFLINMFAFALKIHFSTFNSVQFNISRTHLKKKKKTMTDVSMSSCVRSVSGRLRKNVCVQQLAAGWTWTRAVPIATQSNKTAYRESTDERLTPWGRTGGLMDDCHLNRSLQVYYGHARAELWAETPRVPFFFIFFFLKDYFLA